MIANREMPQYQCHKRVWALKIKSIQQGTYIKPEFPTGSWHLVPEDERYAPIEVSHGSFFQKHNPQPGGYFVVYEDGY